MDYGWIYYSAEAWPSLHICVCPTVFHSGCPLQPRWGRNCAGVTAVRVTAALGSQLNGGRSSAVGRSQLRWRCSCAGVAAARGWQLRGVRSYAGATAASEARFAARAFPNEHGSCGSRACHLTELRVCGGADWVWACQIAYGWQCSCY